MDVFVARQAIFDRSRKVWGYELLFRSGPGQERFDGTEESLATQQVISNSLLAIGLDKLVGDKKACINFGREMLLQESASFLPKEKTVIEILESVHADSEVMAAIRGLERIPSGATIRAYTDSQYVQKGITQWVHGWIDRGWRIAEGKPVQNRDLWERLLAAADRHHVDWQWVRGHSGNPGNEKAHLLAEAAARKRA